jgi:hypothetical protein
MMMMMINDDGDEKWSLGGAKLRLLFLLQPLDICCYRKKEKQNNFFCGVLVL